MFILEPAPEILVSISAGALSLISLFSIGEMIVLYRKKEHPDTLLIAKTNSKFVNTIRTIGIAIATIVFPLLFAIALCIDGKASWITLAVTLPFAVNLVLINVISLKREPKYYVLLIYFITGQIYLIVSGIYLALGLFSHVILYIAANIVTSGFAYSVFRAYNNQSLKLDITITTNKLT